MRHCPGIGERGSVAAIWARGRSNRVALDITLTYPRRVVGSGRSRLTVPAIKSVSLPTQLRGPSKVYYSQLINHPLVLPNLPLGIDVDVPTAEPDLAGAPDDRPTLCGHQATG